MSKTIRIALASGVLFAALSVVAVLPGSARAQQSNDRPPICTNRTVLHLPVKLDDRYRSGLREIRLYVKSGAGDWVRQEAAKPDIKSFTYRVPQDGEYWFSVATVDQSGQVSPADITREPPGLRVLVDTSAPVVDLKPGTGVDGKPCIKCVMQDANPDYSTLKVTYRTSDGRDQTLAQEAGVPGTFPVNSPEIWGKSIHVEAKDRCGNVTQRDFQLQNPVAQAAPTPMQTINPPINPPVPPIEPVGFKTEVPTPPNPELTPPTNLTFAPPSNHDLPPTQLPPQREPAALPFHDVPADPGVTQISTLPSTQATYSVPRTTRPADAARRLLNTTRAAVEYRIDDVGKSGISKVEVYMTGDEGRTWRRLQEDADRRSPAEVNLPGEGTFGIRLAVTNGNGFGGTPPKAGDEPTSYIEVDTTAPFVQLRDVDPLAKGGQLLITWTASDKNLTGEPVSLYFKTRREGPWQVMAVNLPNNGSFPWNFPRNQGDQFFIRIEVRDEAGNVARHETGEPVTIDLAEPRASVTGITGLGGAAP